VGEGVLKMRWNCTRETYSHGEPMESDILCEVAFNMPPKKTSTVK